MVWMIPWVFLFEVLSFINISLFFHSIKAKILFRREFPFKYFSYIYFLLFFQPSSSNFIFVFLPWHMRGVFCVLQVCSNNLVIDTQLIFMNISLHLLKCVFCYLNFSFCLLFPLICKVYCFLIKYGLLFTNVSFHFT